VAIHTKTCTESQQAFHVESIRFNLVTMSATLSTFADRLKLFSRSQNGPQLIINLSYFSGRGATGTGFKLEAGGGRFTVTGPPGPVATRSRLRPQCASGTRPGHRRRGPVAGRGRRGRRTAGASAGLLSESVRSRPAAGFSGKLFQVSRRRSPAQLRAAACQ
jgi:hypothetical protein